MQFVDHTTCNHRPVESIPNLGLSSADATRCQLVILQHPSQAPSNISPIHWVCEQARLLMDDDVGNAATTPADDRDACDVGLKKSDAKSLEVVASQLFGRHAKDVHGSKVLPLHTIIDLPDKGCPFAHAQVPGKCLQGVTHRPISDDQRIALRQYSERLEYRLDILASDQPAKETDGRDVLQVQACTYGGMLLCRLL